MKLIPHDAAGKVRRLPAVGTWPEAAHEFVDREIWALNAAMTAQRPLLVRGEPGTGKSQLARAAADILGRAFVSEVVHARSECQDLQWRYDAVARLGEAQVIRSSEDAAEQLEHLRFLSPSALWWTFDWSGADKQWERCDVRQQRPETPTSWEPGDGCVLLIDEIDKAEADLPNGLLETLGNGAFGVPYVDKPVKMAKGVPPVLVMVTTNEERELPAAFLRRCFVLHLTLPGEKDDLVAWLVRRGEAHFGGKCTEKVRVEAAEQLAGDRFAAGGYERFKPGQAEYLDMLRAVTTMEKSQKKQLEALAKIRDFALAKEIAAEGE
jgi:MoxR-like ATPase